MGSYDTEIRVSTKVDTSQMQKLQIQIDKTVDKVDALTKEYDELKNKKIPTQQYKKLQEELSAAQKEMEKLKAQDSKLSALDAKIGKLAQSSAEYAAKMKEAAEQRIPTQEYTEIQKQIENTEKKINDLMAKQEKMLATGGSKKSSAYKKMEYDLEELRNSLPYLKGELQDLIDKGKEFTLGTDTPEYQNLSAKYEAVNLELEKQKGLHSEIAQKQAESVQKVIELKAQVDQLVESGKAFTLGNEEEISSKFKELESAKAELRMLITKQDELGRKSYKVSDGLKRIGSAARNAFHSISRNAGKSFTTVSNGARQSSSLLSAFTKRIRGLAASAFIFNLLSKGFNSMVSGMRTGFTNLMGYSSSFANSVQSVKNSLSTLGNQIAAAFMPIVQMVIPWLNQLISVIATAMSYVSQFIAALTGKSTYIRAKKVQDSFNSSLGGTSSKADDAADSMDDMADSAKKARGALAAFDDLDVLEKKDDTADRLKDINDAMDDLGGAGGGTGDLFEEVPIENSILDFVDKLKDIFAQLFAPLKKAWEQEGEFVMRAWKYALNEIWKLIKDIGRDFLVMWNQKETVRMLANILHIIGDIGLVIGNIVHALDEAWNKNNTGLHILENIRDIFAVIIQNIREAADYTVLWSETLDFSSLLESIEHLTAALAPFADFVSGTLADFYTEFLLPLASWSLSEDGIPRLINILGDFMDAVDWEALRTALKNLYIALEPYAEAIGEGLIDFVEEIKNIGVDILNALPEPIQKLADALASGDPGTIRELTTTILEFATAIAALKIAFAGIEIVQSGLALFGVGGAASTVATTATEAAGGISLLSIAIGDLIAVGVGLGIVELLKAPIWDLAEAAGANSQAVDYMSERYRGLGGDLNLVKDPVSILTNGFQGLGWEMSNSLGTSGALETAMNNIAEGMIYTDDKLSKMQKNFGLTNDDMEMLRQSMLDTHPELRNLADGFEGLNAASVETLQQIYTGLQDVSNGVVSVDDVTEEMTAKFGSLTDETADFFKCMENGADYVGYYKSAIENASESTKQFSDDINEAGENISTGITNGFEKADVATPVHGFFDRVIESLASVFDMHSPAKNMEPYGENIFLGVVNGFKGAFSAFTDAVSEWWESYVVPWFSVERWLELGESIKLAFVEKWTEIQEWFAEFWAIFTETLYEIWENIILFFTEAWENITLIFQTFIDFINETVIPIWQEAWSLAGTIFQTFHDLLTNIINLVRTLFTEFFQKFVKNMIDINWKEAWENAKKIFTTFKEKVDEVIQTVREIIQSFFDWAMGLIDSILSKISEVGSAISGILGGGGGGEGLSGGGASFAMARTAAYNLEGIPALASGAVIRGGNPFMAVLGDQPRGVTNIETPLPTMVDAFKQAIAETGGMGGSERVPVNINLNYDGETFARLSISDILSELDRQGYNVDVLGVT